MGQHVTCKGKMNKLRWWFMAIGWVFVHHTKPHLFWDHLTEYCDKTEQIDVFAERQKVIRIIITLHQLIDRCTKCHCLRHNFKWNAMLMNVTAFVEFTVKFISADRFVAVFLHDSLNFNENSVWIGEQIHAQRTFRYGRNGKSISAAAF